MAKVYALGSTLVYFFLYFFLVGYESPTHVYVGKERALFIILKIPQFQVAKNIIWYNLP